MCLSGDIYDHFDIGQYGLSLSRSVSDLKHFLFDESDKKTKFDPFVYQTFNTYAKSKNKIKIWYRNLAVDMKDSGFLDLIFLGFNRRTGYDIGNDDDTNLMNPNIFKIFNNVKMVELCDVDTYSFSLIGLLNIIKDTKIEKIDMDGYDEDWTWLKLIRCDDSAWDKVVEEYKNEGYNIEFDDDWDDRKGMHHQQIHIRKK